MRIAMCVHPFRPKQVAQNFSRPICTSIEKIVRGKPSRTYCYMSMSSLPKQVAQNFWRQNHVPPLHRQVTNSLLTRTTICVHAHLPKQVAQNFKLSRCAVFRVASKPKPIEPLPKFWGQFLQHFLGASFEMRDVSHRCACMYTHVLM